MVSARCSDGMGANRALSSAKVCDMATCHRWHPRGGHHRRARLLPEAEVGVSLSKAAKLEKVLEVLGDMEGPVYEAMQAESKRAKFAAQLQPPSVRLEQCQCFIETAKRISHLEAEKAIQDGVEGGRGAFGFDRRPR